MEERMEQARSRADVIIEHGSPEYLKLGKFLRKVADANVKFNGFYAYTRTECGKETKIFIS
jgi:hypothetical protein